jgi:type I site-specific restriction endonuclease
MLTPLNLPLAKLKLVKRNDQIYVNCQVRKKAILLTPEEWVRQHVISYLINYKSYALGRLAVEVNLKVNSLSKRADIVYFNEYKQPQLIVECKAPEIGLTTETVFQIATYNSKLNAQILFITNGLDHFLFENTNKGLISLEELE